MPITAERGWGADPTRRLRDVEACVDRGRAATPTARGGPGSFDSRTFNLTSYYRAPALHTGRTMWKDYSSRPLSRFQAHVQTLQCRHPVPGSGLARAGRALPRIRHSRAPCSLDPHTREDNHAMELNGAHITRLSPPVSTIQCVADSKTLVWLAEGVSQEGTDSRPHCASETSLMTAIDPGRGAHAGAVFVPHTSSHPYCG